MNNAVAVLGRARTSGSDEEGGRLATPKPPYSATCRRPMLDLVCAGRGISNMPGAFGCTDAPLSVHERQGLFELRREFRQAQLERGLWATAAARFATESWLTPTSSWES